MWLVIAVVLPTCEHKHTRTSHTSIITENNEDVDFDRLVKIAERYDCPQPNAADVLVVGWDGSSRPIGPSNSRNAGIYRPAFVINESSSKEADVLMGFERMKCGSRKTIPATREFTLDSPHESLDGYTIEHNHLSNFETCVQLARLGQKELANNLWAKFSSSNYICGAQPNEGVAALLSRTDLLLARAIFEYYENKTLDADSNWREISKMLEQLRGEFPDLFNREGFVGLRRSEFADDLKATVAAAEPSSGTVEEKLLIWANTTAETPRFDFFESENDSTNAPAREIFLRGIKSIEPLIELMSDRRITRRVMHSLKGFESRYRVGELAELLLVEIAGAQSPMTNQWVTMTPDAWRDWLASTDLAVEADFLERAAFDVESGTAYEVPVRVLEARHPMRFTKLVETVADKAKPETRCHYVTGTIRDSRTMSVEEKTELLSLMFEQLPDAQKRSAVQDLAYVNKDKAAELVLPLIRNIPNDVDGQYWTNEWANLTHVVMPLDDIEVWRAHLKAAKKASVGLRMELMGPMNYSYIGSTNLDFRLAFLSSFLDDETIRISKDDNPKFDGPCAAFTFDTISVRDYVTMQLASLILELDDYPDDSWSSNKWDELRKEVRSQLALRRLPDISSE